MFDESNGRRKNKRRKSILYKKDDNEYREVIVPDSTMLVFKMMYMKG